MVRTTRAASGTRNGRSNAARSSNSNQLQSEQAASISTRAAARIPKPKNAIQKGSTPRRSRKAAQSAHVSGSSEKTGGGSLDEPIEVSSSDYQPDEKDQQQSDSDTDMLTDTQSDEEPSPPPSRGRSVRSDGGRKGHCKAGTSRSARSRRGRGGRISTPSRRRNTNSATKGNVPEDDDEENPDMTIVGEDENADSDAVEVEPAARGSGRNAARGRRRRRKKVEEEEEEDVDLDEDVGNPCTELMDPPPTVLMPLLPYQKQFLAWALKQEQGPIRGGILADEMGMGKTIQAISVIMTHRTDDFSHTYAATTTVMAAKPKEERKMFRLSLKASQAAAAECSADPTDSPPQDTGIAVLRRSSVLATDTSICESDIAVASKAGSSPDDAGLAGAPAPFAAFALADAASAPDHTATAPDHTASVPDSTASAFTGVDYVPNGSALNVCAPSNFASAPSSAASTLTVVGSAPASSGRTLRSSVRIQSKQSSNSTSSTALLSGAGSVSASAHWTSLAAEVGQFGTVTQLESMMDAAVTQVCGTVAAAEVTTGIAKATVRQVGSVSFAGATRMGNAAADVLAPSSACGSVPNTCDLGITRLMSAQPSPGTTPGQGPGCSHGAHLEGEKIEAGGQLEQPTSVKDSNGEGKKEAKRGKKKSDKLEDPDRKNVACGLAPGDQVGSYCSTTLVICPVVAIIQWRNEIARFTAPGSLKVLVYHGSNRTSDPAELERADVVLTTYSTIENDFRRYLMPSKVTCKYCQRRFYPERLKVHLRFFCGPHAVKSEKLAKQQKKRPGATMRAMMQRGAGDDDHSDDEDFVPDDDDQDEGRNCASGSRKKQRTGPNSTATGGGKGKQQQEESSTPEKEDTTLIAPTKGKQKKKGAVQVEKDKAGAKKKFASKKDQGRNAKGKGKGKGGKADGGDDEDADFEPEEEEEGAAGPPKFGWSRASNKVWEDRAEKEAAAIIAQSLKQGKSGGKGTVNEAAASVLHKVRWRRIILDEAHCIKDRRCSTAKAVFALTSKYKWALSGTPLQNRVAELYSQIRFLRIFPYGYYFCRKCDCSSLDYSFFANRKCEHCTHSPLAHFCWWNRHVANPIRNHGYQGKGRSAMLLLKNQIMPRILLRRTKVQCADDLALPPRTLVLRKDRFDEREMDFYEALYTQSQAQFDAYISSGTVLNNYAHIFDLLIRLRQAVDHPYLVVYSNTAPAALEGTEASKNRDDATKSPGANPAAAMAEGICSLCHDPVEDPLWSGCKHVFCRACITDYLAAAVLAQTKCPTCSKPLTVDLQQEPKLLSPSFPAPSASSITSPVAFKARRTSILSRIQASSFQSSTKIEALREELHRMKERDANAKVIVFSQFTSMLDLIHFRLEQVGMKCVKLEGGMSMDMRERMINTFTNDPDTRVFLMSLKAGGVALNLTAASHVMLMDPWWNPAVEQQAQDRIHRLGQYKPIHVVRFVIGGTIEERILKLQEKKQLVFEGTVGRDMEALGRLTVDDLRFLFG